MALMPPATPEHGTAITLLSFGYLSSCYLVSAWPIPCYACFLALHQASVLLGKHKGENLYQLLSTQVFLICMWSEPLPTPLASEALSTLAALSSRNCATAGCAASCARAPPQKLTIFTMRSFTHIVWAVQRWNKTSSPNLTVGGHLCSKSEWF